MDYLIPSYSSKLNVFIYDQSSFISIRFWYVDNGVEPVAKPSVDEGLDLIY